MSEYRTGSITTSLNLQGSSPFDLLARQAVQGVFADTGWSVDCIFDMKSTTSDWDWDQYRIWFLVKKVSDDAHLTIPGVRWETRLDDAEADAVRQTAWEEA